MLEKLQNTNIPINTLNLPVIDNKGAIYLNNGNLNEFLKFLDKNIKKDENFLKGLNVYKGVVTYKAVADVFGHSYVAPEEAIKN